MLAGGEPAVVPDEDVAGAPLHDQRAIETVPADRRGDRRDVTTLRVVRVHLHLLDRDDLVVLIQQAHPSNPFPAYECPTLTGAVWRSNIGPLREPPMRVRCLQPQKIGGGRMKSRGRILAIPSVVAALLFGTPDSGASVANDYRTSCSDGTGGARFAMSGVGWIQGSADLRYGINTSFNVAAWLHTWSSALDHGGTHQVVTEATGDVTVI